ncbi:hypothetical protein DL765_007357 [Monosporascus sp. GIB2]|nr:hypothetical protein DL765_007357 [Monosporascus sp. GIB2]
MSTDGHGTSEQNKAKRGDSDDGDWTDPSDYRDPENFVAREAWFAYNEDIISTENLAVRFPNRRDPDTEMTTSELYIPQRGAWASHIWEPTFTDKGDRFETKAIKYIMTGLDTSDPQYQQHKYGLVQMRGSADLPEIGKIFGDGFDIRAPTFTFLHRGHGLTYEIRDNHGKLLDYTDRDGKHLDDEMRRAEDANAGAGLKFPGYVDRIKEAVLRVVGTEVPVEVIEYSPNVLSLAKAKEEPSPKEIAAELGDNNQEQPRGKLLLQYQPGKCGRPASWRLWVESQLVVAGRYAEWDPSPDQIFQGQGNPDPNVAGGAKVADACIVLTPSSISTKTEENPTDSTGGTTTTNDPTGSTEGTTITDNPRIGDGDVCDEIECSKKLCPDGSTAGCQPILRLPGSLGTGKFCGCPTSTSETPEATATPELPPPPSYEKGTCNLHIHEWSEYYTQDVNADFTVYDGAGNVLYDMSSPWIGWDEEYLLGSETKLPHPLKVTLQVSCRRG